MPAVESLTSRLATLQERIAEAAGGRHITLVAVSKTQPAPRVVEVAAAGITRLGENYVQEGISKITATSALTSAPLEWHHIGSLQSNKAKAVAHYFDWVHGLTRATVALALNQHRAESRPPLNVLIQVNISGETTKDGVTSDALFPLMAAVIALPRLSLRGIMGMAAPHADPQAVAREFARGRTAFLSGRDWLASQHPSLAPAFDTLSMGMSQDFAIAIREGATLVRIGSAIFGERPAKSRPTEPESH
jgi:PLP dependent protein